MFLVFCTIDESQSFSLSPTPDHSPFHLDSITGSGRKLCSVPSPPFKTQALYNDHVARVPSPTFKPKVTVKVDVRPTRPRSNSFSILEEHLFFSSRCIHHLPGSLHARDKLRHQAAITGVLSTVTNLRIRSRELAQESKRRSGKPMPSTIAKPPTTTPKLRRRTFRGSSMPPLELKPFRNHFRGASSAEEAVEEWDDLYLPPANPIVITWRNDSDRRYLVR